MRRRILITLLFLFQLTPLTASELDIIELRNRPAEDIIPLIKPLLNADESLTGRGFQLILKADTARQTQIRTLVSKLDRAAAQLMISVFQGSERDQQALGLDAGIRYQNGDTTIRIGNDRAPHQGAGVVVKKRNIQAAGKVFGTNTRMQDNPVYRLRITEGGTGYIETGKSIPYFSGQIYQRNGQNITESSVAYKDAASGFYVRPHVNGDQVILDISPYRDTFDASATGAVNTRRAATTIRGALGQWIPLGGTTGQIKRSSGQTGKSYSTQDRYSENIWIKAERVQ